MAAADVHSLALAPVPAPVRRCIAGEASNLPSEEAEVSGVADCHPETRIALLDHAPARLSGAGSAYHPEGGPQVTSVEGLGMGAGVEAAQGATRCAPVARAHAPPLDLARAPPPTLLIHGIVGVNLAQGL